MIQVRPICLIRQFGKVLELHINSFKNGHRILHWYKQGDSLHTSHQPIYKADVRLDDFMDEGYYCFYTTNAQNERSALVKFYVLYESTTDRIRSILSCAPSDIPDKILSGKVVSKLQSDLARQGDQRIPALIFHYLESAGDIVSQTLNSYYQLAYTAERFENQQNRMWNLDSSESYTISYGGSGKLTTNGFITDVVVEQEDGRILRKMNTYTETDIPLGITSPGVYYIKLYIDGDLVNELIFLRFGEELTALKWEADYKNQSIIDKIENERLDIVTTSSITLTNTERNTYSTEIQMNPEYAILPRCEITPIDGSKSVEVHIPDYGLLEALGKSYTLCVKENDMLFTNYFDNNSILTSGDFTYLCDENYLSDDCYFSIHDPNGKTMNKLTMHSPNTDLTSFKEKIRRIEIEAYEKRMLPVIEYRASGYTSLLSQFLHSCLLESDTPAEDIWLRLLEHVLYDEVAIDKNTVAAAIVEEFNCSQVYDTKFFSNPVIYSYSEEKLVFPPRDVHYVLVVHSVSYGSRTFESEYYPSSNGAIEISLKDKSKYVIYAIDSETYHMSGIFYINMEYGEKIIRQYNMNTEVK